MRTTTRSLLLAFLLAVALPACSGEASQQDPQDEDPGPITETDAGDTTDPDESPDGGDEIPDAVDADEGGDDADGAAGDDEDADADDEGTDDDAGDDGSDPDGDDMNDPDDATDTPDTPNVDAGHTGCSYPPQDSSCKQGDFGPGSFISELRLDEECCRDFNNDSEDDNALATLAAAVNDMMDGPTVNEQIATLIDNGDLIYLFEYAYWSDEANDSVIDMYVYPGEDHSAPFTDNLNGNGSFDVVGNGSQIQSASVQNSTLTASGGTFDLEIPIGPSQFSATVYDLHVTADVQSGADLRAGGQVTLTNGEISGYVEKAELYRSLNEFYRSAQTCGCSASTEVFQQASNGSYFCDDSASCIDNSASNTICKPFMCSAAVTLVENQVDTTTPDGDDAYSFGARFEAVDATLVDSAP